LQIEKGTGSLFSVLTIYVNYGIIQNDKNLKGEFKMFEIFITVVAAIVVGAIVVKFWRPILKGILIFLVIVFSQKSNTKSESSQPSRVTV